MPSPINLSGITTAVCRITRFSHPCKVKHFPPTSAGNLTPVKKETKILQKPCTGIKYTPGREQDETKSTTVYCDNNELFSTLLSNSHYVSSFVLLTNFHCWSCLWVRCLLQAFVAQRSTHCTAIIWSNCFYALVHPVAQATKGGRVRGLGNQCLWSQISLVLLYTKTIV